MGLLYYGKRWYNPEIGRFYSVDPARFDESNIHSFNRYAYGNNNPYKFVDPDGEEPLFIAVFHKGTTINQAMGKRSFHDVIDAPVPDQIVTAHRQISSSRLSVSVQ